MACSLLTVSLCHIPSCVTHVSTYAVGGERWHVPCKLFHCVTFSLVSHMSLHTLLEVSGGMFHVNCVTFPLVSHMSLHTLLEVSGGMFLVNCFTVSHSLLCHTCLYIRCWR